MAYTVRVPRKTQKQIARLPAEVRDRIDAAVHNLELEPRSPGCRKLGGREESEWRIRVGNYRIVYEIRDDSREVLVLEVWHRQRGYR